MVKKSQKEYMEKIRNAAAILAIIASLLTAVCWITSGKAGGAADDEKMVALSKMILRLESSTEASTARVQAQTYLTQAAMYLAQSEIAADNENKAILENLWYQSWVISEYWLVVAENHENRAQSYYGAYENSLAVASERDSAAGDRSTGALVFNVAAMLANCAVLIKRRELLYVFLPIFAIGAYYLTISVF